MTSSPAEALKVLVVDDDAQMLRSISDILRLSGYSAVIAGTGSEAIEIARDMKFGPAVALVDPNRLRVRATEHHELGQFLQQVNFDRAAIEVQNADDAAH